MRFLMSSGIQKNSITFSSSWCLTEPYAFSRSNQMTWSSADLLFWAIFIQSHNIVVQYNLESWEFQPFVLMYWHAHLFIMNLVILFDMTPKKILPSMLSKEIGQNWSSFLESFSFGMWIPSANPQLSAIIFLWASHIYQQN